MEYKMKSISRMFGNKISSKIRARFAYWKTVRVILRPYTVRKDEFED